MLNVDEFLNYMKYELNRSRKTVDSYAEDLKSFEAYFKNLSSSLTWNTIGADVIRGWAESMMDKGNKSTSVNRRLSAIRAFYRYALSRNLVDADPAHRIHGPKKNKRLPQFLKEDEMERLLDLNMWDDDFKGTRDRTIVLTFYDTGVRLSELVGLVDESVDLASRELKVTGKGNKQRVIPFGEDLCNAFRRYLKLRDASIGMKSHAFFVDDKGYPMSDSRVRRMIKESLSKVCSLKKKSPHVLRHTFATAMLNHEGKIESLKKLLGHAKLSTTEIYTHTTFEQLKRVYKTAHPRA